MCKLYVHLMRRYLHRLIAFIFLALSLSLSLFRSTLCIYIDMRYYVHTCYVDIKFQFQFQSIKCVGMKNAVINLWQLKKIWSKFVSVVHYDDVWCSFFTLQLCTRARVCAGIWISFLFFSFSADKMIDCATKTESAVWKLVKQWNMGFSSTPEIIAMKCNVLQF